MVQAENPKTVHEATKVIHKTLTLTMKACWCATNGTLGHYTSGALAFKRDMLMMLTNQFTGAWTHYTDTVSGTRTDHMVESFQRISIE